MSRPSPRMNASVCSQTRERRALLVVVSGSSESSSVVPAGQLSAKSSLESIKVLNSLVNSSLCNLCVLRVSVVTKAQNHHRDTEDTEVAQRSILLRSISRGLTSVRQSREQLLHNMSGELSESPIPEFRHGV